MSQVTFKFNLPEETEEFEIHAKAIETHCHLSEFRNFIRNKIKHDDSLTEEAQKELEEVYSYFCETFPQS